MQIEQEISEIKVEEVNDLDFDHLEKRRESKQSTSFYESGSSEEAEKVQCPSCRKFFEGNLQWITEKHLVNCLEKKKSEKKKA